MKRAEVALGASRLAFVGVLLVLVETGGLFGPGSVPDRVRERRVLRDEQQ